MWKPVKGDAGRKQYHCACGNAKVILVREPVARKVRSMSAHKKRVVAHCTSCGAKKLITYGGGR
jgi:RNase P subunit RPR2